MAKLTTLEEKLAKVTGLAKAAQEATQKVEGLVDDEQLQGQLQRMRQEAEETERRCIQLAEGRDGKKTAISREPHKRNTKGPLSRALGFPCLVARVVSWPVEPGGAS
jgi:TolA-binding protein